MIEYFIFFITESFSFYWFPKKKIYTKNKYRCEQRYIHFCIMKFQIIEQLYIKRINESPELWSLWKIRIYKSFNKLSLANRHLDKANKRTESASFASGRGGNSSKLILWNQYCLYAKTRQGHSKDSKVQASIPDEYRRENSQQNLANQVQQYIKRIIYHDQGNWLQGCKDSLVFLNQSCHTPH